MKTCQICNSKKYVHLFKGELLCCKHLYRIKKHNSFFIKTRFDKNDFIDKGDYLEIILCNRGRKEVARTKIDKEDFLRIKNNKIHRNYLGRVVIKIRGEWKSLHRFIMKTPKDVVVDHINHDVLDNRKSNLRNCTRADNSRNKTNVKGMTNRKGSWRVYINFNYKQISLGSYKDKEEAIRVRREAEKKYFGEFAINHL